MKYKYEVIISAEVKVDGKTKYIIEGGNTYCSPKIKDDGWGYYTDDKAIDKIPFVGNKDINKRSLIANITDHIMSAFFDKKQ